MRAFLILGVLFATFCPHALPQSCLNFIRHLNLECVRVMPKNSTITHDLAALVCGRALPESPTKENLTRTSMIHIFVVSGSHLILIEQVVSLLIFFLPVAVQQSTHGLVLFAFTLITGASAPTVRAFISWGFRIFVSRRRLNWSAIEQVTLLSFLLLTIYPIWFSSFSFILSSLAALGMAQNKWAAPGPKAIVLYVLLFPPLYFISAPHPLSILCNLLLVPVVGLVLFPLALLTCVLPFLTSTTEYFFAVFHGVLSFVTKHLPMKNDVVVDLPLWIWIYFVLCFFYFSIDEKKRRAISL